MGWKGIAVQPCKPTGFAITHAGDRPADVRVVMIHALNPYGMAWVRRVNEDNVDLNRNFIDWSEPSSGECTDYDTIAADVVPDRLVRRHAGAQR